MERVCIDQVQLDPISIDETIHRIMSLLKQERRHSIHVATLNAQFVHIASRDKLFARILRNADLSVADGVPLIWASRLLRQPLPGRVNGTDLMLRLCEQAASNENTVYFLGGRPGAAEEAAKRLTKRYPGLLIVGVDCPPMGFMSHDELDMEVSSPIEKASPDFLFVGLGAPRQEYWIHKHRHLSNGVMIGIGGSFELIAGVVSRAPVAFQRAGLEWLWRLVLEPKRLWKRYLVGNLLFLFLVFRQWLLELMTTKTPEQDSGRIGN